MSELHKPRPVTPVIGQLGVFIPRVGGFVIVALHGEHIRAQVEEVVSDDVLVAKLTGVVINKSGHGFKSGDILACRRSVNEALRTEEWVPISDRETKMREEAQRLARQEVEAETEVAPAPKKRGRKNTEAA